MFLQHEYSEKVAAQQLHRTNNHCDHYTYNYCSKHKPLAQPHFFWTVLAEHERDDYPRKDNNAYQQKNENPLTELLTAHPFDTEVKLRRDF